MNSEEAENRKLLEGNLGAAASRYLTIYLGEPTTGDWNSHITELYNRNKSKQSDIKEYMQNTVSCAILMPTHDTVNLDEPENVLHKCPYWRQINERDWFADLKKIAQKDLVIMENRSKMLSLGVIEPLAWQPYTRQAYNWLYTKAENEGNCSTAEEKALIKTRMSNVVYAYGGMVVCSVFDKSPDHMKKILNWRSGYFFERAIYQVYKPEEMYKIKKAELTKTNTKLVKSIRL